MATSSIFKNFVIEKEDAEAFAEVIEQAYQASLTQPDKADINVTYIENADELKRFMKKRKSKHV